MPDRQTTRHLANQLLAEMEQSPGSPDTRILLDALWRHRLIELLLNNYLQSIAYETTEDPPGITGTQLRALREAMGYPANASDMTTVPKRTGLGVWMAFRKYTPAHEAEEKERSRPLRPSEFMDISERQKKK